MIVFLVVGIVAGFVLAIPPGPVAAYILQTTILKGKRSGVSASVAVAIVDTLFCVFLTFASTLVLQAISSITQSHPTAVLSFEWLLVLAIVAYAIYQLLAKQHDAHIPDRQSHAKEALQHRVHSNKPFIIGAITAFSNVLNPTFLPSLGVVLSTVVHSVSPSAYPTLDKLLFACGFGVGTYAWLFGMNTFIHKYTHRFSPLVMQRIRHGGAMVMLAFGLFLGWQLLST